MGDLQIDMKKENVQKSFKYCHIHRDSRSNVSEYFLIDVLEKDQGKLRRPETSELSLKVQ